MKKKRNGEKVWRKYCDRCHQPFSTMRHYGEVCPMCDRGVRLGIKRQKWMGWE